MNRFKRLLAMECKKAFRNRYFYIMFIVAMLFTFLSALYQIDVYLGQKEYYQVAIQSGSNPETGLMSLYNRWIGGEAMSLGYTLFFTLLPLIAAFPYGWSQSREQRAGYTKNVVVRVGKWQYFFAKYIATFLSGGTTIALPMLFNFILVACFIPANKPSLIYYTFFGMNQGTMMSDLYYASPLAFVVVYLVIDFIFSGLLACLSYALSFFVKNAVAVVLIPFIGCLVLHYGGYLGLFTVYTEISPLNFLHPTRIGAFNVIAWVVLLEGIILFALTFGVAMGVGKKRETM